jgi:hypothetical protein
MFIVDKGTSEEVRLKGWPSLYYNHDKENINIVFNKGYNEKLFKPYYRGLIAYSIISSYFYKFYNWSNEYIIFFMENHFKYILKGIKNIDYNLYNFVTVKVLLDILHYNYRSLIRIKPRYYFINKLRLYHVKFRRINLNNWIASIRFIKKLRKTPKNFWYRLHLLASTFFSRIVRFAELDTKRNVLIPFVIYFEDILYTIYGKWVLVRLWPLKRYYLSSYILAGRIITLILWRKKKVSGRYSFQRITTKLIAGIRILQIKRAYNFYIDNSFRWPKHILNILNNNLFGKLNYTNMEWYNDNELRTHKLESYALPNDTLSRYLSSIKNNYIFAFNQNIRSIKKFKIKKKIWRNKITNLQFMYYWLRPLKYYIITLNKSFDITGLRLRLSGRAGTRRN